MKPYLLTTGIIFTLIAVAHIARFFSEWPPTFNSEMIIVQSLTLMSLAFAIWAFTLFFKKSKS